LNKQKTAMFLSLEGSEGVGKSTSVNTVKNYISSLGHKVLVTREPGGTPLAEQIRDLLLSERDEKVDIDTELLMMFAARAQHVNQVIKPALESGTWVICDRFVSSL
jgi:dTMP kinase